MPISIGKGGGGLAVGGGTALSKAPVFTIPIFEGTTSTNTAHSGSKQSLAMSFFNPAFVNGFGGTNRQYFYRAIVDVTSTEPNMSGSVDLYDVNGIVAYPPAQVPGSMMSSSAQTPTYIQVNLTSILSAVTGSGIFEARLWRTVSGSLTSSVACRNARIEVEYS
jgi:hypothetical protein